MAKKQSEKEVVAELKEALPPEVAPVAVTEPEQAEMPVDRNGTPSPDGLTVDERAEGGIVFDTEALPETVSLFLGAVRNSDSDGMFNLKQAERYLGALGWKAENVIVCDDDGADHTQFIITRKAESL